MTDLLIDTTFFIDLRRGNHPGAQQLWQEIQQGARTAAVSPITIYELWVGQRMNREEELFYDSVFALLEEVPLTGDAAESAGVWLRSMGNRTELLVRDALIAATAQGRDEVVLTNNCRDFELFPDVQIEVY